ncbi:hypothetical protein [Segniliparus rugosus]|uniref:hypothetical protein n=1 Tax=Segniliparus rugosus TaxID=286804 RepID=UPI00058E9181|nr:hypothetical protein [Segniliparus rugosus]
MGAALTFAAVAPGRSVADPDFPAIPTPSPAAGVESDDTAEADSAEPSPPLEDDDAGVGGPASGHDCVAIKYAIDRVNALMSGQVPIAQGFASTELGEQAVDKDLNVLNQVEQYLVYAESGIEDPGQRAKVEAYKAALGQVSMVVNDRRGQNLTRPAAYEWVGKLSESNRRASDSFLDIGKSCLA